MSQRHSRGSILSSQPQVSASAVNECVRFILYREGSKLPIQRAEIKRHLSSACGTQANEVSAVISAAEDVLKNVYGYKLIKDDNKGVFQYIVVLQEPCDSMPSALTEKHEQLLLNTALAHIFMSGGSVKDEDMWTFLKEAGLIKNGDDDIVRKLFTKKFPKQLYLSCVPTGESRIKFEWGSRANKETTKMFILEKVAQSLGKKSEHWSEQYKIASQESTASRQLETNGRHST